MIIFQGLWNTSLSFCFNSLTNSLFEMYILQFHYLIILNPCHSLRLKLFLNIENRYSILDLLKIDIHITILGKNGFWG